MIVDHHSHRPHRPPSSGQPARQRRRRSASSPATRRFSRPAIRATVVDVVEGSHGDAEVVDKAAGSRCRVLARRRRTPRRLRSRPPTSASTWPAAEAFKRNGVKCVVAVTALGRGTAWAFDRAGDVTASLAMDDLIGSFWVWLPGGDLNPSFMDNLLGQAQSIKNQGVFFSPIAGDRKLPSVATRDIAATAARLLLDDTWSGVEEVPLLGPADLSFNDMAEIMSEVLGTEVRFQQIPFEAYKDRFLGFGMSDAMAQGMTDMAWAKNEGLQGQGVKWTPENSTLTSFRTWCEEILKPAVVGQTAAAAS